MKRGIIYIILICVCLYIGIINRQRAYFYVATVMTVAALCLLAGLVAGAVGTQIAMEFGIPVAEKNRTFQPKLTVTSKRGRAPYVSADFKVPSAGRRKLRRSSFTQTGKRSGTCSCNMALSVSGRYRIITSNVRIYDAFHMFYVRRKVRESVYVYVLPECFLVPITVTKKTRDFVTDSDVYYPDVRGDDSTETFQVREYRPGDRMQSIHWKLTAKQEELMVRDMSKAWSCPVIICMNLNGAVCKKYGQAMSVALDTMVSISFSLVDVRVPHFIAWYDTEAMELTRYRILREEDVYDAAAKLSYVEAEGSDGCDVIGLYREKYRGEDFTSFIDIDMAGNVTCAETSFHVSFDTAREDIQRICITV